ncbi:hypothetical protein [Brucella anthropi]|uniref:hypothetical protein n=1 Tax=Brucella anthropi TaxID=529 RepID=UPI00124DAC3F|nr:hypothetical protein [Brucella anthropi]KAB2745386.1 hypothetical protein F9K74_01780 [Brucella anthropi]KAB2805810.1 hypothetical protein F9K83_01780 [Brucella anthropi]
MTTLPEYLVKGVYDNLCRINGEWQPIGPNDIKEVLTAAIPFLPVQGAVNIDAIVQPLEDIHAPGGLCRWTDVATAIGEVRRALSALEPSAARELALEEAANRFDRIADIINRNLYHQQEKIKDAQYIAAEGSAAIPFLPVQGAVNIDAIVQPLEDIHAPGGLCRWTDVATAIGEVRRALSALEPSAARELALEEAANRFDRIADIINRNLYHQQEKIKDAQYIAAEGSAAIRSLSSPGHADAGKVEGDVEKWSIREIVAKAIAYHSVGDPHAKTIRGDQRWEWFVEEADKFISVFGYYLPAIPSAPASDGAE